jgi:hypothetical protein
MGGGQSRGNLVRVLPWRIGVNPEGLLPTDFLLETPFLNLSIDRDHQAEGGKPEYGCPTGVHRLVLYSLQQAHGEEMQRQGYSNREDRFEDLVRAEPRR